MQRHLLSISEQAEKLVCFCLDWEVSSCDMLSCCMSDPVTTCLLLNKIPFVSLSWMWIPGHGEGESDITAHWNSGKHSLSLSPFSSLLGRALLVACIFRMFIVFNNGGSVHFSFPAAQGKLLRQGALQVLSLWLQLIGIVHNFSDYHRNAQRWTEIKATVLCSDESPEASR